MALCICGYFWLIIYIWLHKKGLKITWSSSNSLFQGRGGKGAIYVFAAGNGKMHGDNCAADGYINSIYTVPIASATQRGEAPFYGERCAAIFATAYSSGNRKDEKIVSWNFK